MAGTSRESLLADADGHVMEPEDLWVERMDPAGWGDRIPRSEELDDYPVTSTGGRA